LNTKTKTCSFNCIYCQLSDITQTRTEPSEFVSPEELAGAIQPAKQTEADFATFSGMGEPTLVSNLEMATSMVKSVLNLPIAVLINSSLMYQEDIRQQLVNADMVIAKLDAPDEEVFITINRPATGLSSTR
jgi:wyosine [tRNA(Phe)-imidazoG37] synthetase (radical SAM superfamily)